MIPTASTFCLNLLPLNLVNPLRAIIKLPRSSVALGNPYVIFFQPTQRDLPLNAPIDALIAALPPTPTSRNYPSFSTTSSSSQQPQNAPWRGNVLVAKYADVPFGEMIPCGMNDLPIIARHLQYREPAGNEFET